MDKDPRQVFMDRSQRLAEGEILHDSDLAETQGFDLSDPRQRFMRDSLLLAEGKSPAEVKQIRRDEEKSGTVRQVRCDAFRRDLGGRLRPSQSLPVEDEDDADDPRTALLKKLSALSD